MQLESARLLLREFAADDWSAVHGYASRPEVCRFQVWGPNTPAETQQYVARVLVSAAEVPRTEFTLAAILRDGHRLIGAGSFFVRSEHNRSGEIGYIVHPDFWRQGIASEIAATLLRFGFEHRGLHRIFATCDPRNVGSAKVLMKAGLTFEGRLRHAVLLRDGWRDSDVYSILEHEWRG
jgi:RimJ/RimL family protein N-acetyltransferase